MLRLVLYHLSQITMLRKTFLFSFSFIYLFIFFGYECIMAAPSLISAADSWYVLYLMDIGAVWLLEILVFFCRIVVSTACKS